MLKDANGAATACGLHTTKDACEGNTWCAWNAFRCEDFHVIIPNASNDNDRWIPGTPFDWDQNNPDEKPPPVTVLTCYDGKFYPTTFECLNRTVLNERIA